MGLWRSVVILQKTRSCEISISVPSFFYQNSQLHFSLPSEIDFNPYEVLGLKFGESIKHVKKAYKDLARKCHPDKAKLEEKETAEATFHTLKKAYDFLSDKELKEKYDREGAAKLLRKKLQEEKKAQSSATRKRFVDELEKSEADFGAKKSKVNGPKDFKEMNEKELNAFRSMNKEVLEQFNANLKRMNENNPNEKVKKTTVKRTTADYSDLMAAEEDILGDLLG
uniref:J domain-containing protein n=1 Tax=Panagrolaimus davidi TaxID=227884 RepID=A0A914PNE7_9BILA